MSAVAQEQAVPAQVMQAQVLIVGAGPVGVTLGNLLGTYGISTLLIERNLDVLDYPRAVGIDDEALRTFQSAGMADAIVRDVIQNVPMRMYTADRRCFAEIQPTTREFGWYRRNLFSQPLGEATLRLGLRRFDHVSLRSGVELLDLVQDEEGVQASIIDEHGAQRTLRAQYVVGCDGGRSTVREKILKLPYEGKTHPAKWVVIECDGDPLDAPYTALHCEPQRPYVCLALPYGVRRWEFMLFPGEDGEQMLAPEKVRELLREHVRDVDALNIIRARVYTHNSRVAGSLVCGRICLAGDAAHITPPWIGQGLNAGLRDAFNLAWKLAWVLQGRMKPELLASYHEERHAHVKAMIDLADLFGAVLSQKNRLLAWCRDKFFLAIKDIPRVRDYVLQMKFKPMPSFSSQAVMQDDARNRNDLVGRMFLQSLVENGAGEVMRLDDLCGGRFVLLSWRCDVLAAAEPGLRSRMQAFGCDYLQGVRSRSGPRGQVLAGSGVVVQDYENKLNAWFKEKGVDWVLLRPDRFIAAAGRAGDAPQVVARYLDQVAA
ncbi:bifunctional 3-(3-hydroxy-phenyl)propionate/3-hydroxycinnamic acid hydroxylase [Herbaspirillum camelliae]|uniref:bifunctional 3-(3-hydroxy-phenyl)propionate/3-hydroxycinnamic acid hydroxylase n=1 Tax=Herbaspirillum camelliae TaxID=1892903 RepID=UPI0009F8D0D8|nr:bifunctional 3-(3-hydroxy-phenyl)propionate/3-hydroxycinnamic acid hydroxylase [Herbaspirillum camelliae]